MSGSGWPVEEGARALYLGAAGRLALVRCGLCGRRNCFDRRSWWWLEVMFCRRCWQAVCFADLTMITRWEGERLLMENTALGGELRALREVERVVRSFLAYYDSQPFWEWSPRTRGAAAEMRRSFSLVEAARARRGHAETPATPTAAPVPPPAGVSAAGDLYELTEEEARALDYFAACPPAVRGNVLDYLEVMSRQAAGGEADQGEVPTPALPAVITGEDEEEGDDDG